MNGRACHLLIAGSLVLGAGLVMPGCQGPGAWARPESSSASDRIADSSDIDPSLETPPMADVPDRRPPVRRSQVRRLPEPDPSEPPAGHGPIWLVAHFDDLEDPDAEPVEVEVEADAESEEVVSIDETAYPIDLANALALGGASSLQIRLARERVIESQAESQRAHVLWLPSLRAGLGYNRHDGQLQATEGPVVQAGRNSLFVGGGAGLGDAPLAGGAGGPPRLMVNLSLADAFFEPLVARRIVRAESSAQSATVNDALLAIGLAYFDLVEAHGLVANARTAREAADDMVQTVELFAHGGSSSQAEVDRAQAEAAVWRQRTEDAQRVAVARSAELVRQVRLDPYLTLVPVEEKVAPIALTDPSIPREAYMAQGLTSRPELAQHRWLVDAALRRLREERWRPWLPSVQVGASGGPFGGGPSDLFENQAGRGDLDLLAVWEWRNLGLGNVASQRQRASQMRQACLEVQQVRDRILAEIVTASENVASYQRQMDVAADGVESARESYLRNAERVLAGEGLPIELLQSIRARAAAQDAYTQAITAFNRSQVQLLRAIGEPIDRVGL